VKRLRSAAPLLLVGIALAGCGGGGGSKAASAAAPPEHGQAVAGLASKPALSAPSPWPAAEYDAAHSGLTTAVGPQTGHVRWARSLGGAVSLGPAIGTGGTVYATTNDGVLHALDPATGKDRWTFHPQGDYSVIDLSATPAVLPDGTLLWPGPGNALYAVDQNGHERWHLSFQSRLLSPAVVGQRVYVVEVGGVLHAIDLTAGGGRVRWSLPFGTGTSYGSPVVSPDHHTIYATIDRQLVALSDLGSRARVAWRFQIQRGIEVSAAVAPDGTIVLGTNDPYEYGISPKGHVRWRWFRNAWTYSSAAVTPSGIAVFGDHHDKIDFLDTRTGKLLGQDPVIGQVWTAPAIDSRGDVYVGTHAGHVVGYSARGKQLFDVTTGGSVESYPALDAHGTLYIGSEDGKLYAIGG
jgi:outer membrane protein assembly factor BamB